VALPLGSAGTFGSDFTGVVPIVDSIVVVPASDVGSLAGESAAETGFACANPC